jgi:hypothetical protein
MSRKHPMHRETEKEDYVIGEHLQTPALTHVRTTVKTQVLNTRIGPRINLQLAGGCLLFHETTGQTPSTQVTLLVSGWQVAILYRAHPQLLSAKN